MAGSDPEADAGPDFRRRPRVLTIDPGLPFLATLVDALFAGQIVPDFRFDPAGSPDPDVRSDPDLRSDPDERSDPLALADVTILVPTRRAARALRGVILDRLGGRAAILPRIAPLGDIDEDAGLIDAEGSAAFARDLEPEVDGLERLLGLTRLVVAWTETLARDLFNPVTDAAPTFPASPAEAAHLARALLTLMDQVETEGADWAKLASIVPDDHAAFWGLTLSFLTIVTEHWPAFLAERGLADPARQRNRAVRREAERLAAAPPKGPVIAAGSTGSIPATAALLATIAGLPRGAVVLPGLDRGLDADSWTAIGGPDHGEPAYGHPQYGLKQLLDRGFRIDRSAVEPVGPAVPEALTLRARVVAEALKPAGTTETWPGFRATVGGLAPLQAAFAGVGLMEARSEAEQALAIALALREVLESDGRTAALVTPDRTLARRVAAELGRWGLAVDDSAGVPLLETPPAVLARMVAEVACGGFEPVALVGLLQHPLAAFGLERAAARRAARALEIAALRGPRPSAGSEGLAAAFAERRHAHDTRTARDSSPQRRRLGSAGWQAGEDLIDRLAAALGPLERAAAAPGRVPLADLLGLHVAALRAVAADADGSDARLFEGEAGEALATALAGLIEAARADAFTISLRGSDYPAFFEALVGHQPVRRRAAGTGSRIAIWGPLEARLQSVDRLILAGLDEGTWPAVTRADAWLSRPMKRELGLEAPERRIGLAAHDFVEGVTAPEVFLSRSARSGGAPTVPSRWLHRLLAVVGPDIAASLRARGAVHLDRARRLDRPAAAPAPAARPEPKPPVEARPNRLSVTEIETLIRDPYAIYARHVLRLQPMEELAEAPDGGDRGSIVHEVLHQFVAGRQAESPAEAQARFMRLADDALEAYAAFPEVLALWRPRLEKMGAWFIAQFERPRAGQIADSLLEQREALDLPVDGTPFTLVGRADRIDRFKDGGLAILDYKTGTVPSAAQVQSLLAPQLPLEAGMVRQGAFGADLAERPIAMLAYVKLSGTGAGGAVTDVTLPIRGGGPPPSADELAAMALDRLRRLVSHYRNPATGYPSRPRIQFQRDTDGPYDHLARVKEWAAGEGGESE
jgi:ATP-dependent helicase/nuclease subunit B